jgi:N-acetylneuraminic acid mutarotase
MVQSGTTIMYVGGSDGTKASDKTFISKTSGVGNFDTWAPGPKLPEPRTDLSVIYSGGKIYAIGGLGADGKPTTSVYVLTPDSTTGALGEWQTAQDAKLDLVLPEARAGATAVAASDGLLLVGGTNGTAPVNTVLKTTFDSKGVPSKWAAQPGTLFTPVTDASAAIAGSYLWVYGGTGADGKPVATVQRGEFGTGADATKIARFGV